MVLAVKISSGVSGLHLLKCHVVTLQQATQCVVPGDGRPEGAPSAPGKRPHGTPMFKRI